MFIFFSMSIFLSILTVFYSHPVAILISILAQTIFICMMVWMMTKTSWFSFILFLIFLGGLMVLFVYISSLASNEMFKLDTKKNTAVLLISFSLIFMSYMINFFFSKINLMSYAFYNKLFIIFSKNLVLPTILIMIYLLLVLIIAVKISSKMEGPIRNFIN